MSASQKAPMNTMQEMPVTAHLDNCSSGISSRISTAQSAVTASTANRFHHSAGIPAHLPLRGKATAFLDQRPITALGGIEFPIQDNQPGEDIIDKLRLRGNDGFKILGVRGAFRCE